MIYDKTILDLLLEFVGFISVFLVIIGLTIIIDLIKKIIKDMKGGD